MNEARPGPARAWRRLLRSLVLSVCAVALAVALLAAGIVAVSQGWQRARVLAAFEEVIAEALATPVRIGALQGDLLSGFELRELRLGPAGSEFASVRRLALQIDLESALTADPIVIDEITIEGAVLLLRRDGSGWNLPVLPESEPLPRALRIRRIRALDSQLDVAWSSEDEDPKRAGALAGDFEGVLHEILIPADDDPVAWGAAQLSLALEAGALAGTAVERGALHAELDGEHQLQLTAVGAGGFGQIGLQGRGALDAWLAGRPDPETRVDLVFDALDLAVLTTGLTPATRLEGSAELGVGPRTGRTGAPELVFAASLRPSQLGPIALRHARVRGTLLDEAWSLDDLSLDADGIALAGSASGKGGAPQAVDLTARLERLERLSDWLKAFGRPDAPQGLAGSLALDVKLHSPEGEPGRASGKVGADAHALVWQGTSIGDLSLRAAVYDGRRAVIEGLRLDGEWLSLAVEPGAVLALAGDVPADGVVIEGLRASSQEATLAVDGRVGPEGLQALHLRLAGLHPARIGALEGIAVPSAGRVAADLVLNGPFDAPRAEGWVSLADGAAYIPVLRETFSPIDARVQLENEVLLVETLTVGPPGARAEMSGRIALPGFRPGPANLHLRVEDFALTRVPLPDDFVAGAGGDEQGAAPPAGVSAGGRVDANLHLEGPLLAPTVTGDLDWRQPRWEEIELERISLHVEADGKLARGSLQVRYAGSEILVADARLPVPENAREPLDWLREPGARIEIRGESLDFALLSPFLTRLVRKPRGTADLQLVVRGARPDPTVDGLLTVEDGSLQVPLLRQTFAPVAGVARFDGHRVSVESLSIGTPQAGLQAHGYLDLVELRPDHVELSVQLANFPASRSRLITSNVDGQVELEGPVLAPTLRGRLELRETRVTVQSGSDPVAREVRVRTSERDESLRERAQSGPSLLDRAAIDLALVVPGDTWIRSPDLELDVEGWARLEKRTLEPPRISGELSTRRGTVRVVGKRFRLRRGTAILDGGSDPDPVLDIEAIHPVADLVVVAYVTGRASEPVLRLESEPPLPEDEVVSYLFFGRPSGQLAASEQGNVSLAAAGLAAGMALDELREVMGHDLPIDTIEVRIQEGNEPSRVELGKYVARDVFVRYGQTFGSDPIEEVGVSYRIDENWRVESTTSSDASAGIDLFWTIDY